jgi:hypothetical protein
MIGKPHDIKISHMYQLVATTTSTVANETTRKSLAAELCISSGDLPALAVPRRNRLLRCGG